jgi:hypothetical protein
VPIVPAPRRRAWMDAAKDRWPNRCLPLLVANESGWVLLNPVRFRATWNGDPSPDGITVEFVNADPRPHPVSSHFGEGVLTFGIPYVFRTPPRWNLLARGPANWPKEGIAALEGLVETDWSFANFTMNWKFTRTDYPVEFEQDEPFCMLVPQRRGELESFRTEIRALSSDPETKAEFDVFEENREQMQVKKFLSMYSREYESYKTDWERHYYKGLAPSGAPATEHQTHLKLSEFDRRDS